MLTFLVQKPFNLNGEQYVPGQVYNHSTLRHADLASYIRDGYASLIEAVAIAESTSTGSVTPIVPLAVPDVVTETVLTTPITGVSTSQDHSGSIQLASVSQVIIPANAARRGWILQNTSEDYPLWFHEGDVPATMASPSFKLLPGQLYQPVAATSGTVSVISPVAGERFTAREII